MKLKGEDNDGDDDNNTAADDESNNNNYTDDIKKSSLYWQEMDIWIVLYHSLNTLVHYE